MHERADDPRAQYMYDLNILLARLRKKNYQVILAGDTNINLHKQATSVRTWKTMMEEHNMKNTMATWWPRMIHKLTTWGRTKKKNYWIDHIYMTNTMIKEGSLIGAGIETGHNFYSSDHNMIGININWTKALGRIP
jgi:exonuclease III